MLNSDRPEFEAQLATLCSGFNVPMGERSGAYWLGLQKMDLATFARVVADALGEGGPEKMPTVGMCWTLSKKTRVARYIPQPAKQETQWRGDHWDIEANHHLLNYLRSHPKKYAPDSSYEGRQAVAGPLTERNTKILAQWKKTWAEDMRAEGNPSPKTKRESWEECMQRADAQIAELSRVTEAA